MYWQFYYQFLLKNIYVYIRWKMRLYKNVMALFLKPKIQYWVKLTTVDPTPNYYLHRKCIDIGLHARVKLFRENGES